MMHEPAVTLTDYGLTVLCLILGWRVLVRTRPEIQPWLFAFFIGPGAAALFGGTVHGFFPYETTLGFRVLWPATLISIGATAVAAWGLGARVGEPSPSTRLITGVALAGFAVFTAVVVGGTYAFGLAVAFYMPAVVYLTIRFARAHRANPTPARKIALWGLGLTFLAAAIQQLGVPIHPVYFDHNALYHVVQAVAFVLFYRGAAAE